MSFLQFGTVLILCEGFVAHQGIQAKSRPSHESSTRDPRTRFRNDLQLFFLENHSCLCLRQLDGMRNIRVVGRHSHAALLFPVALGTAKQRHQ